MCKGECELIIMYGTEVLIQPFIVGVKIYIPALLIPIRKAMCCSASGQRSWVDDTIYGYEIVNIEGTPTKLLTSRADVNLSTVTTTTYSSVWKMRILSE